jgi:hypothetical protein
MIKERMMWFLLVLLLLGILGLWVGFNFVLTGRRADMECHIIPDMPPTPAV